MENDPWWRFQAQEDAEMLRSVVLPLEEEINMMKDKLKDSNDRCQQYANKVAGKGTS